MVKSKLRHHRPKARTCSQANIFRLAMPFLLVQLFLFACVTTSTGVVVLDGLPVAGDVTPPGGLCGGHDLVVGGVFNGHGDNNLLDGLLLDQDGRDPFLSLSLFEPEEREEADLLFNELERILSPAPDDDMNGLEDVHWNNTDSAIPSSPFLARTYEAWSQQNPEYFDGQETSSSYVPPEVAPSSSYATLPPSSSAENGHSDPGSYAEYGSYAGGDYSYWTPHASSSYHSMSSHSSGVNGEHSATSVKERTMETSGDSAVSSMSSGRISSSSEGHGWTENGGYSYPRYYDTEGTLPSGHPVMVNHTYATDSGYTEAKTAAANSYQATMTSLTQAKRVSSSKKSAKSETDDSQSILSDEDAQFSRDERRARALNIPIPTLDVINLPIDEFNEKLTKYDLTEAQLSLIRDIRRRGKNKVAAQNCRKRKMDQIMGLQGDVDRLFAQKESLEQQQAQLLYLREMARDKYSRLYNFIRDSRGDTTPDGHFTGQGPPEDPRDPSGSRAIHVGSDDHDGDNRRHAFVQTATLLNTTSTSPSGHLHRHHHPIAIAAGGPALVAGHEIELE